MSDEKKPSEANTNLLDKTAIEICASQLTNSGVLAAATTINSISKRKPSNTELAKQLIDMQLTLNDSLESDNLIDSQQSLMAQAITLDSLFHRLTRMAFIHDNPAQFETLLKLALKAQAQSRCSYEAISKIKNPPNPTFVKQQNVAQGHQQVNNIEPSDNGSHG